MAILKLHFSPSTQKLEFNETTLKSGGKTHIANCNVCPDCIADGYQENDFDCGGSVCFDVPSNLCVGIRSLPVVYNYWKRCSDNTIIDNTYACVSPCAIQTPLAEYSWTGTITIDGSDYTIDVHFLDHFRIGAVIYNDDDVWFKGSGDVGCEDFSIGFSSSLVVGDCGNNVEIYVDCMNVEGEGPISPVNRKVVAYGGSIGFCDPNTGDGLRIGEEVCGP